MATNSKNKKKSSDSNPSVTSNVSSDKKPKPSKPTEEPEQAAGEKKPKAKDEIGEIFSAAKASKKRKPLQREEEEAIQGGKRKKAEEGSSKKKRNKNTPGSKGKNRGLYAEQDGEVQKRPRRRTADGLAIHSAEELGFGNAGAGGTPLCPFDCDCCF